MSHLLLYFANNNSNKQFIQKYFITSLVVASIPFCRCKAQSTLACESNDCAKSLFFLRSECTHSYQYGLENW